MDSFPFPCLGCGGVLSARRAAASIRRLNVLIRVLISHMTAPPVDPLSPFGRFSGFFDTYKHTTPRGAALSAVADLDHALQQQINGALVGGDLVANTFGEYGPLGGFGQKVRFAFMTGLLSEWAYRELDLINKVRNCFAHTRGANDFNFPKVLSHTKSLQIMRNPTKFVAMTGYLDAEQFPTFEDARKHFREFLLDVFGLDIGKPEWAFTIEVTLMEDTIRQRKPAEAPLVKTPCV